MSKPKPQPQGSAENGPQASHSPVLSKQKDRHEIADTQPEVLPPSPVVEEKQASITTRSTSWFGLWSTAAPSAAAEVPEPKATAKVAGTNDDTVMEDAPPLKSNNEPVAESSSWAFWSTDTSKKPGSAGKGPVDVGQVAVSGEPSEHSPEPAKAVTPKELKKITSGKRGRPQSTEIKETPSPSTQADSVSGTPVQPPVTIVKKLPPNLLVPTVKQTYTLVENPSILQQIARLLLHAQQPPANHLFLVKEPPIIKKALAIG